MISAKEVATAFKAWAQDNHLLGHEFPVELSPNLNRRDELFNSLKITSASERLLRAKHVTAVAFNDASSEVVVMVSRKLTKRELDVLPKTYGDNITFRYLHCGNAQATLPTSGLVHSAYVVTQNGHYACGSSIHPARHIGAGTLGCLVRNGDGALFGLTNNHVSGLCSYSIVGEKILAPGHPDIEANGIDPFTIGYHEQSLPMVPGVPDNVNVANNKDAALFKISDDRKVTSRQGWSYDTPAMVETIQSGQAVQKVGRTTGHTYGTVTAQVVGPFPVAYQVPGVGNQLAYFDPVFVVQGSATSPFSQSGDSGSLVVAATGGEVKAVGLVFAGDQQGLSYVLPLWPILTALNMTIVSGHNV